MIHLHSRKARLAASLAVTLSLALPAGGCSTAYYGTLEKFGIEKRDILADRVEDARGAQEDAREQFDDALERYQAVVQVDGGDLEEIYDRLNASFKKSQDDAEEVTDRIEAVEDVAEDLFEEWQQELGQYSNPSLKQQSEALLRDTRRDYQTMLAAMKRAEASMQPVLALFNDQVLFLRHNLNARAIGSLQSELGNIEAATAAAIADMEKSIAEATRFIESMK